MIKNDSLENGNDSPDGFLKFGGESEEKGTECAFVGANDNVEGQGYSFVKTDTNFIFLKVTLFLIKALFI